MGRSVLDDPSRTPTCLWTLGPEKGPEAWGPCPVPLTAAPDVASRGRAWPSHGFLPFLDSLGLKPPSRMRVILISLGPMGGRRAFSRVPTLASRAFAYGQSHTSDTLDWRRASWWGLAGLVPDPWGCVQSRGSCSGRAASLRTGYGPLFCIFLPTVRRPCCALLLGVKGPPLHFDADTEGKSNA